jgi:alginate O-acetyltransferase complex protein AlgI
LSWDWIPSFAAMLFNSAVFLQFFTAFLLLYWLARNSLPARNLLIVAASYLFYGWWAPENAPSLSESTYYLLGLLWHVRFLGLLLATSLFDFLIGLGLAKLATPGQRKLLVTASIAANLSVLGFFKYCDFFAEFVSTALDHVGLGVSLRTLHLVLPVGISFYTFQSMSYTIDVYRGQLPPTRKIVDFLAFVSFFPQLVAGPIERASHLLPQFQQTRVITRAMLEEGVWLILWGLFKKVVIADNCAPLVEMVYGSTTCTGPAVALGTLAFALQIYCDFSGYSDIARGTARVLGFDIMWNFHIPYAATSPREFWRRWHISLSTWLRDYLYISLGGNRRGSGRTYFNLVVTMLLGGLWHGAAWNFVLWGLWHGAGLVAQRAFRGDKPDPAGNKTTRMLSWIATMAFVLYGWLLFRADSMTQVASMTRAFADFSFPRWTSSFVLNLAVFSLPLVLMEGWMTRARNQLVPLSLPGPVRSLLQGVMLVAIVIFWERKEVPFIYFQF